MPARNFRNVILCDHAYADRLSNKAIIAGVYSGDILLSSVPGIVRFSIYAEYIPDNDGDQVITLDIHLDRKRVAGGELKISGGIAGVPAMLLVPPVEINIERPSLFELRAYIDGGRPVNILKKRLIVRAEAVFSNPPPPS